MRATRRRQRTSDPLAHPEAVRAVCEHLRSRMRESIPNSEKQLIRFLHAVRHVERRPATDTKRGRPSRWRREDLVNAASCLRTILERETSGRVSLNSFIEQYLPILNFPGDVVDALTKGDINLQEAAHLSRMTAGRLDITPVRARSIREEVLRAHLLTLGSQNSLRARAKEVLGEVVTLSSREMADVVQKVDELLVVDASDKRHLFYEEMKRFFSRCGRSNPKTWTTILWTNSWPLPTSYLTPSIGSS